MSLTEDELNTIFLGRAIVGGISLVCSTAILIIYFSFKELQFFFMRLIMFMIFTDAIHSVCLMLPSKNEVLCYIQAVLLEFSSSSGALWALMICIALYIGIVNQDRSIEKKTLYFCIAGYGLPVILTILPAALDTYGEAGGWCWISQSKHFVRGSILRLVCFYAPLTIVIICSLVLYGIIIKTIKQQFMGIDDSYELQKKLIRRMMIFPLILILCYTPIFIMRILNFAYNANQNYIYGLVSIICTLCVGILNAIAYGLNGNVKDAIRGYFRRRAARLSQVSMAEDFYSKYKEVHSTF